MAFFEWPHSKLFLFLNAINHFGITNPWQVSTIKQTAGSLGNYTSFGTLPSPLKIDQELVKTLQVVHLSESGMRPAILKARC